MRRFRPKRKKRKQRRAKPAPVLVTGPVSPGFIARMARKGITVVFRR